MRPTRNALQRLYLATNDMAVVLILAFSRDQADRYAWMHGLTILKSDQNELIDLVRRGAKVNDAAKELDQQVTA